MIEESYVSLETARLLKEAGFDVPCDNYYDKDGFFRGDFKAYMCPTQALAARWLRETHGIHVSSEIIVCPMDECVCWKEVGKRISWGYYIIPVERDEPIIENDEEYKTYEEALEAGLKRGLKLIKK